MNKIKVIHVLSSLEIGGMENGVVNLSNKIDPDKFEIVICCVKRIGSMAERLNAGIRVLNMGLPEGDILKGALALTSLWIKEKPEIVHTHGWGSCSLQGVISALIARVPVIINGEHGKIYSLPHQKLCQKMLYKFCDLTFFVSESLRKRVLQQIDIRQDLTRVISNGVDSKVFNGSYDIASLKNEIFETTGIRIEEDDFVIGNVGSLKPEKNQIMVLRVLKEIKRAGFAGKIKLILVGNGPMINELKEFVRDFDLSKEVVFLGERNDLKEIYCLIEILAQTSIKNHEGMSNVILEAMASEIPVITTKSIGVDELIEEGITGFCIEDDSELYDKLLLLQKNRNLLKTMSVNARKKITEKFSLEKMVYSYDEIYSSLIRDKGPINCEKENCL